jgi:lipopolysaccharide/colanic/teichoic acid biosynthesis glycosyltransferase
VLKGDMSLVGPRPLSFDEMRYNPRWRDARLAVRPGVTGLWQVEAHTKLEFNEWIRQDLDYVHNVSMALDLKILYRTLTKALSDLIHTITGRPQ